MSVDICIETTAYGIIRTISDSRTYAYGKQKPVRVFSEMRAHAWMSFVSGREDKTLLLFFFYLVALTAQQPRREDAGGCDALCPGWPPGRSKSRSAATKMKSWSAAEVSSGAKSVGSWKVWRLKPPVFSLSQPCDFTSEWASNAFHNSFSATS